MRQFTILLIGFGMLLGIGCSKDADNDPNDTGLSVQEVQAQMQVYNTTNGLDEILANLLIDDKSATSNKNGTDCAVLNFTEESISITYNQCNVNGDKLDGTITLTGNDGGVEGTEGVFVISFDAFKFNDYLLDGTKSITFDFSNTNSPVFTIATDIDFKNAKDEIINHKGSKILTWHLGQLDGDGEGDFSWTGSWDIAYKGTTYSFEVAEPLFGTWGCAYIISGVIVLEANGQTASLDFGQGACDKKGTVIYPDGKSKEINW